MWLDMKWSYFRDGLIKGCAEWTIFTVHFCFLLAALVGFLCSMFTRYGLPPARKQHNPVLPSPYHAVWFAVKGAEEWSSCQVSRGPPPPRCRWGPLRRRGSTCSSTTRGPGAGGPAKRPLPSPLGRTQTAASHPTDLVKYLLVQYLTDILKLLSQQIIILCHCCLY